MKIYKSIFTNNYYWVGGKPTPQAVTPTHNKVHSTTFLYNNAYNPHWKKCGYLRRDLNRTTVFGVVEFTWNCFLKYSFSWEFQMFYCSPLLIMDFQERASKWPHCVWPCINNKCGRICHSTPMNYSWFVFEKCTYEISLWFTPHQEIQYLNTFLNICLVHRSKSRSTRPLY